MPLRPHAIPFIARPGYRPPFLFDTSWINLASEKFNDTASISSEANAKMSSAEKVTTTGKPILNNLHTNFVKKETHILQKYNNRCFKKPYQKLVLRVHYLIQTPLFALWDFISFSVFGTGVRTLALVFYILLQ